MALLTVGDLREHVETALGDDALQLYLDAAEQDILVRAGPVGTATAYLRGGSAFVFLPRRAASLTTVKEVLGSTSLTLGVTDYRLRPDGVTLERLYTGTNPKVSWDRSVEVVYVAVDDLDSRRRVQLQLVGLDINHEAGLTSRTIGEYSETFASNSVFNYAIERENILSTLAPAVALFA